MPDKTIAALLTIVLTDVVESSATKRELALGRDSRERDRAYLEKVQTRHFNLIRGCAGAHGGREVSNMGDAFYLVFEDPVEAVRCGLEIQRELAAHPIETPRGPLRLRIGLHSGYPEYFEGSYHGTDVDTAARVEAATGAQQVALSSRTYELVRHMSDVKFHRLGEFVLKGVERTVLWEADWDGKGPRATAVLAVGVERRRRQRKLALVALAAVLLVAAFAYRYAGGFLHPPALTEKDTILLADFTNTTEDSVFDGTLRQGLSAQLEQSPFLNLLSDDRIARTLALMTQPKDARLTPELAHQVCLRTASAAMIEGSIDSLGREYVLGLKAVDCHSGDLLAEEQVTANDKEKVLEALGEAATAVRKKLGESLATVEKYDAPPENVTTPSLEALQAYSLGWRAMSVKADYAAAVPFFQRAISLDPSFAMAYARLGTSYHNLGETARAAENTRKAFELRERVSERENFYIASHYRHNVTGDLEAGRKIYELWADAYPRDEIPPFNLGVIDVQLGEYTEALAARQKALQLAPGSGLAYGNLALTYMCLNRLDESKATAREAQARHLDVPLIHEGLYQVAFLQHDAAAMEREAASFAGKPRYEDAMLYLESDTAAYAGQFVKARELTERAADSARHADNNEAAAGYEAEAAVREALVGNTGLAKQQAEAALALSHGRDTEAVSTIAMAWAGDAAQARSLASDLDKRFPEDTAAQFDYLPMIRAASILGANGASKDAEEAIQALAKAEPYELGSISNAVAVALYPAYLRGEAYLRARQGAAAAAEFQKIVNQAAVVQNEPIGALAHLGLGRAYALEAGVLVAAVSSPPRGGQRPPLQPDALAKARAAYEDFFALWKNADPDIPILKQAQAEYAGLH